MAIINGNSKTHYPPILLALITLTACLALFTAAPDSAWADENVTPSTAAIEADAEATDERDVAGAQDPETAQPDESDVGSDDGDTQNGDSPTSSDEAAANPTDPEADAPNASPPDANGDEETAPETTPGELSGDDGESPDEAELQLQPQGVTVYRLYNPNSGEHFYTESEAERDHLDLIGWRYEGIGWIAPGLGDEVFRLYNPNSGDHHYTLSADERDALVAHGWNFEGTCWFSGGDYEIFRQYNPNALTGAHNFTTNIAENDYLASIGWSEEGTAWLALADTDETFDGFLYDNCATTCATLAAPEGKDVSVDSSLVDGVYYLLLPSFADLSQLRLSAYHRDAETTLLLADYQSTEFSAVAHGSFIDVTALSTVTAENGARLLWFRTSSTSFIQRLAIMVSAQIGSLYIDSVNASQDRDYVEADPDHQVKADVIVTMRSALGQLIYDEDSAKKSSTIKGRGNSTWGIGEKKPYQISLSKKADLLQTGNPDNAQKKWLLLANANDVTLLRNTIAYNLALELGMVGTECVAVDLYYDGQYRGSYLLCEKIEVKPGRVDIADLESAFEDANPGVDFESLPTATAVNAFGKTYQYVVGIADPADVTGGYLLEIDTAYYDSEPSWFESSLGTIVVKSPEFCSRAAMKYISEYTELAIQRFYDNDLSPVDGVALDLDSLVKTYLISEYAKNIDAFNTSTYLYKLSGASPLYFEPLWDFDASMGIRKDWHDSSFYTYEGFTIPHANGTNDVTTIPLTSIPALQERAREIWKAELAPIIDGVLLSGDASAVGSRGYLHSLAYYRAQIAASQKMDEVVFGLSTFANSLEPFATYELNYDYLANWLAWRSEWITDNIGVMHNDFIDDSARVFKGVDYSLVFDASYLKKSIAYLAGFSDAYVLRYFVTYGMDSGLVASRNFDVAVYRERYEDLSERFGDDWEAYYRHYMQEGFFAGRTAV